jgi:hypothetical protein
VGYFVSVVLTRSSTRVTALPSIERIGYRHVRLRELGAGWQILETQGPDDPPNLDNAVTYLSRLWNEPVLAAYVSDDWCAQTHWAMPGQAVSSVHLPRPQQLPDCGFRHNPTFTTSRDAAEVADDIERWAQAAGLSVARRRLDYVVAFQREEEEEEERVFAGDQIFELIRALGFADIPPSVAKTLDPYGEPFNAITAFGLAHIAHLNARQREKGRRGLTGPEQPWEQAAIDLDVEVFAAAFADECNYHDLVSRALAITAQQGASDAATPSPLDVPADVIESLIAEIRLGPAWSPPEPFVGTGLWPELSGDQEPS